MLESQWRSKSGEEVERALNELDTYKPEAQKVIVRESRRRGIGRSKTLTKESNIEPGWTDIWLKLKQLIRLSEPNTEPGGTNVVRSGTICPQLEQDEVRREFNRIISRMNGKVMTVADVVSRQAYVDGLTTEQRAAYHRAFYYWNEYSADTGRIHSYLDSVDAALKALAVPAGSEGANMGRNHLGTPMPRIRWVVILGVLALIASSIVPPWTESAVHYQYRGRIERIPTRSSAGYHSIFNPPQPVIWYEDFGAIKYTADYAVDRDRLILEWCLILLVTIGCAFLVGFRAGSGKLTGG